MHCKLKVKFELLIVFFLLSNYGQKLENLIFFISFMDYSFSEIVFI